MRDENRRFFESLYDGCDGLFETRILPKIASEFWVIDFYSSDVFDFFDDYLSRWADQNIYFGVATRDGNAGKKENIVSIPAVWCDVDFKDTPADSLKEKSTSFPFKPSAIVHTGGGYHLYWFLNEPVGQESIPIVEDVNRRIAGALGGDMNACDASRILRVPGSRNMKPGRNGADVRVLRLESFRYEIEDFLELPAVEMATTSTFNEYVRPSNADIDRCAFIRWCAENPADVSEPRWYAMVSNVARVYPGGISLVHQLSHGHPGYDRKETDSKILHALNSSGPMTCTTIKSGKIGFTGCPSSCVARTPIRMLQDTSRRLSNEFKDPFDA